MCVTCLRGFDVDVTVHVHVCVFEEKVTSNVSEEGDKYNRSGLGLSACAQTLAETNARESKMITFGLDR